MTDIQLCVVCVRSELELLIHTLVVEIFHSYTLTLGAVSLAALWTAVSRRGRFNMLTAGVQDGITTTLVSGWVLCHLSHIWPKRKGPASAAHCIALCRLWPVIQESIYIQSCSLVLMPSRLLRSWQFVPVRAFWVSPSEIWCFELCCGGNVTCCLPITDWIEDPHPPTKTWYLLYSLLVLSGCFSKAKRTSLFHGWCLCFKQIR